MTTYTWPGWCVNRWEMRVVPNTRVFTGPYTPSVQTLDFLGERWSVSFDLVPGNSRDEAGEREAFFDRLYGPVHRISLWNLARPRPRGTFGAGQTINVVNGSLAPVSVVNGLLQPVTVVGGTAVISVAASKGASTVTIQHIAGRTLKAGDMLGFGGQLVRVLVATTFNGSGVSVVEFAPRLRAALPAGTVVVYDKPTATFALRAEGVPVVQRPGMHEGSTLELIETF